MTTFNWTIATLEYDLQPSNMDGAVQGMSSDASIFVNGTGQRPSTVFGHVFL